MLKKTSSKSIRFPFITQLKYCQKLDFEADPNNKLKPLLINKKKNIFFDFKIKILPKIGF